MPDIAAIAGSTAQSVIGTTAASQDSASLASDFDDFLTLLTTQLQNQDPLDPMDSGEFTNQLVSFAGVEQQIKANDNLEVLAQITALNNAGTAVSYLGQDALVGSNVGEHSDTGVNWQYAHTSVAGEVVLEVRDEDDNVVYSQEGEITLGTHDFNWDGYTTSGELANPGNYELTVKATDQDNKAIDTGIAVFGRITASELVGLEPYFTIGANTVPQSEILQVLARK